MPRRKPDRNVCAKEFILMRECNRPGGPQLLITNEGRGAPRYEINPSHLPLFNSISADLGPAEAPKRDRKRMQSLIQEMKKEFNAKAFDFVPYKFESFRPNPGKWPRVYVHRKEAKQERFRHFVRCTYTRETAKTKTFTAAKKNKSFHSKSPTKTTKIRKSEDPGRRRRSGVQAARVYVHLTSSAGVYRQLKAANWAAAAAIQKSRFRENN